MGSAQRGGGQAGKEGAETTVQSPQPAVLRCPPPRTRHAPGSAPSLPHPRLDLSLLHFAYSHTDSQRRVVSDQ
ncbi:hypothetical protein E2C01_096033 [Portunus trituberculatus]|uniref:Uncharacterized protein n=1 Tax=Portunus trituberculatus TaxID=210409 RepID=A0A5B7K1Q8_PORTR|nr:hypothetical protein [Portunus trituberculatus]